MPEIALICIPCSLNLPIFSDGNKVGPVQRLQVLHPNECADQDCKECTTTDHRSRRLLQVVITQLLFSNEII